MSRKKLLAAEVGMATLLTPLLSVTELVRVIQFGEARLVVCCKT